MKQPTHHKDERILELTKHCVSEYIARESNRQSLITVTSGAISDKLDKVTIFVTVLPDSYEQTALTFLKRQASEIREYVKEHARIGRIPFLSFEIDSGEKNRQRIDTLSQEVSNQ